MNRIGTKRGLGCQGLSIVEAVVALFLFGMFIASACKLIIVARESSGRATDHYQAICLGKNRIERLQSVDFSQLERCASPVYAFGSVTNVIPETMDRDGTASPEGRFRMTVSITNLTTNLKWVMVNIEIRDRVSMNFEGEYEEVVTMLSKQLRRGQ